MIQYRLEMYLPGKTETYITSDEQPPVDSHMGRYFYVKGINCYNDHVRIEFWNGTSINFNSIPYKIEARVNR